MCSGASKWSVGEVQDAIDEHERDYKSRRLVQPISKVAVTQSIATEAVSGVPATVRSECMGVNAAATVSTPAKGGDAVVNDSGTLERVLSMLERVLERTSSPAPRFKPQGASWQRPSPCAVCGDRSHSTHSHCMKEKRCLTCLEIGHLRRECHKAVSQAVAQADLHDQGN